MSGLSDTKNRDKFNATCQLKKKKKIYSHIQSKLSYEKTIDDGKEKPQTINV